MADKNVSIDIIAADRTRAAFESVKRGLGEVDSKLSAVKGTIGAFSALASAAGLTQLVSEAVQAGSKAEQSSNRLDAVLRATGNTVGYTREQLDGMADALAKATTFDDDGVRDAMATLTKFGNLHGATFEKALKYSADYAAFTGTTMAEAAQAVGKAFSDPINGGMMLERQLGKLTDAQDASIKKFVEQGDVMSAQQVWAEKLEKSIGGTGAAMNTGLFGATSAAKKSWDELMESMGRSGASKLVVENSLLSISALLDAVKKKMEETNREAQRLIDRSSGKLQPLPPELSAAPPSATRGLTPGMTAAEIKAAGDALRAQQDEQQRLRDEAAAAYRKKQNDLLARYNEDLFQRQVEIELRGEKELKEIREKNAKEAEEAENRRFQASVARLEAAQQAENAAMEETNRTRDEAIKKQEEQRQKYIEFREEMAFNLADDEVQARVRYERDMDMVNEAHAAKYVAEFEYQRLMGALVKRYETERTRISDEEIKKRFGISNVYRRLDMQSAGFFFDQMAGLMQTKSRTLFEIGKAGAIAGAIIDTYKAATGAYAALASIPFVGPALGAAAAAAAVAVGIARVQAIKSTSFGGGGASGVGVYAANPSTGLPQSPTSAFDAPVSPLAPQRATTARDVNITIVGEHFSQKTIREQIIPAINEAVGDGVRLRVTA